MEQRSRMSTFNYTSSLFDAPITEPSCTYSSSSSPSDEDSIFDQIIIQTKKASSQSSKNKKRPYQLPLKPHQKFSPEDDETLTKLVSQYGESNWVAIAENMPGRNSRQCRERWLNYLSPALNKSEFTPEEDELIVAKVDELGTKWVTISKHFFPNRTDQMIKNRYYMLKRKAEKRLKRSKGQTVTEIEEIPSQPERQINQAQLERQITELIVQGDENVFSVANDPQASFEESNFLAYSDECVDPYIFGYSGFDLYSF